MSRLTLLKPHGFLTNPLGGFETIQDTQFGGRATVMLKPSTAMMPCQVLRYAVLRCAVL